METFITQLHAGLLNSSTTIMFVLFVMLACGALSVNNFCLLSLSAAPLANSSLAHLEQNLRRQAKHRQQNKARAGSVWAAGTLNSNSVGVKHQSATDIKEVVWWLTQSQGRPATRRVPNKHIRTRRHSIQGAWNASTFASQ